MKRSSSRCAAPLRRRARRGNISANSDAYIGRGEVESLCLVTAEGGELGRLIRPLHTFGDGRQTEHAGHVHDRGCDGAIAGVLTESLDERAVDLQDLDRELLEVRERRVTGAEVVERETHAEAVELIERRSSWWPRRP